MSHFLLTYYQIVQAKRGWEREWCYYSVERETVE